MVVDGPGTGSENGKGEMGKGSIPVVQGWVGVWLTGYFLG